MTKCILVQACFCFQVAIHFLVHTDSRPDRNLQEFMCDDLRLAENAQLRPGTGQLAQLRHAAALWFELSHLRVKHLAASVTQPFHTEPKVLRKDLPCDDHIRNKLNMRLGQLPLERFMSALYQLLVFRLTNWALSSKDSEEYLCLKTPLHQLLKNNDKEDRNNRLQYDLLPEELLGKHVCAVWCRAYRILNQRDKSSKAAAI